MDGETDWKLRVAVGFTHKLQIDSDVLKINGLVEADKPNKDIYNFLGSFQSVSFLYKFMSEPFRYFKDFFKINLETFMIYY